MGLKNAAVFGLTAMTAGISGAADWKPGVDAAGSSSFFHSKTARRLYLP